jgi:hypothetical protein
LRVLEGVDFRGVLSFSILSISLLFSLVLPLSCLLLALWFFPLLDDIFKLFLVFLSSSCASWGFGFELQTLCFLLSMDPSSGRLRI